MTTPGGGIELAQIWVPLMPEASRLAQGVNKIAFDVEKRFGRSGKVLGGHMAKGIEQGSRSAVTSMRDVEKATDSLAKARQKDEDAAGRVRVAQARLDDVLAKGKATAAQRVSAEENLARAQRNREQTADKLTRAEKDLERATEDSKRAANDAAAAFGEPMGARAAGGFLSGFSSGLGGLATRGASALESAGGGMGGSLLGGFATKLKGAGAAGGIAGGVLLGGIALGKLWFDGVMKGVNDYEVPRDMLVAKLGIDEQTAGQYADAAGRAYANNFGASVQDNLTAVAAAKQAGLITDGMSGAEVQKVIEHLQTVQMVLGEDVPAAARAAGQMIKTGLVSNVEEATDVLIAGQQKGLNLSGDWLDTINEYGTQFRKLGLSGADVVGLVSQMVQGGARDSDVAADALKEFSIRVLDGSKTTTDAFTEIGLNYEEMSHKFVQGGPVARQALDQTVDAIKAIPDPVKRSQVAVALFGTQAEDLGGALDALDLDTVADDMDGVAGATERAADTMNSNAAAGFEKVSRTIERAKNQVTNVMGQAFAPAMESFSKVIMRHQGDISRFFLGVADAVLVGTQLVGGGVEMTVRFIAELAKQTGDVLGLLTKGAANLAELVGADGLAKDLRATSDDFYGWGEGLENTADKLGRFNRETIPEWRNKVHGMSEDAKNAQQFTNDLGDAVDNLTTEDGKVILDTNAPEVLEQIDQTQYAITHLDDGTVELVPLTDEATRKMDGWRRQQGEDPLNVEVGADTSQADADMQSFLSKYPMLDPNAPPTKVRVATSVEDLILPPGASAPAAPAPRARGGIFDVYNSVSSFANGKLPQQALIQPPVAGAGLVQWAEPSTGGEAFIPLGSGNRKRSTAIWLQTGRMLGALRFERGGIRSGGADALDDAVSELSGAPYVRGGFDPSGVDCSGAMSYLINRALGRPNDSRMATGTAASWLAERGFKEGAGGPGTFRIGWYNGGPGGGHMAGTLPDETNVEAGGSVGNFTAGGSVGADDPKFTNHMYLPLEGLYPDGNAYGSGSGIRGYGSSGSGGGSGSSGGSGGGGYSSEADRQEAISDAQDRLATAEGEVREKEARLREVEADADAKESQRIAAENDLAKAQRDRDKARAELVDAENKKVGDDDNGSGGKSKGPSVKTFGQDLFSGALEALGFDGDVFSDPTQWGVWKLFTGGANWVGNILKKNDFSKPRLNPYGGDPAGSQHGRGFGSPGPGNAGDGGMGQFQLGDGGGMSGLGDTLLGAIPGVGDFLPSPATQAAPIDASINIHGNVDRGTFNDMKSANLNRVRSAGSGLKGMGGF